MPASSCGITPADYPGDALAGVGVPAGMGAAGVRGGGGVRMPRRRRRSGDLLEGRASRALGAVVPSYQPGVALADLAACLPGFAVEAIREAWRRFAREIPGFAMHDAVLTGVETRTSSPIRIVRGAEGHSVNTPGLFPGGRGGRVRRGDLSAGVDGIRVAEAVACCLTGVPLVERMTRGEGVGVYG